MCRRQCDDAFGSGGVRVAQDLHSNDACDAERDEGCPGHKRVVDPQRLG
jgi:hypothetical protein